MQVEGKKRNFYCDHLEKFLREVLWLRNKRGSPQEVGGPRDKSFRREKVFWGELEHHVWVYTCEGVGGQRDGLWYREKAGGTAKPLQSSES